MQNVFNYNWASRSCVSTITWEGTFNFCNPCGYAENGWIGSLWYSVSHWGAAVRVYSLAAVNRMWRQWMWVEFGSALSRISRYAAGNIGTGNISCQNLGPLLLSILTDKWFSLGKKVVFSSAKFLYCASSCFLHCSGLQKIPHCYVFLFSYCRSLVVVHFWAPWAPQCVQMNNVMAELAKEHPQVMFVKVSQ